MAMSDKAVSNLETLVASPCVTVYPQIIRQNSWLGSSIASQRVAYVAAPRKIMRWERNWERTLLPAARWCSAVLGSARYGPGLMD